jgi:hypothetical protein
LAETLNKIKPREIAPDTYLCMRKMEVSDKANYTSRSSVFCLYFDHTKPKLWGFKVKQDNEK